LNAQVGLQKKVNNQAQRERMSKKVRAMDRWEQSPTYAAKQGPQEVEEPK
jgi:hypothetical protein